MIPIDTSEKLLLTVAEAAALLSIKKSKAYEMVAQGAIPSVRLGPACIRIPRKSLEEWIQNQIPAPRSA